MCVFFFYVTVLRRGGMHINDGHRLSAGVMKVQRNATENPVVPCARVQTNRFFSTFSGTARSGIRLNVIIETYCAYDATTTRLSEICYQFVLYWCFSFRLQSSSSHV